MTQTVEITSEAMSGGPDHLAAVRHDNAIQHLFAMGLRLEASARRTTNPDEARTLRRGIDELDEAIGHLRVLRASALGATS